MRFSSTTVPVAAIALLVSCSRADDRCDPVQTQIVTNYSLAGCASPVGVCTSGNLTSGDLAGTTRFTALTMQQGPAPDAIYYTGNLVITTPSGSVTVRDSGVLDATTGAYFELQQVLSGTEVYQGVTGTFTSQGYATATGFAGDLTGALCGVP